MTPDEKQQLLAFIGETKDGSAPCVTCYPLGDDNERRFYAACCELEREGLVERIEEDDPAWNDPAVVVFGLPEEVAK